MQKFWRKFAISEVAGGGGQMFKYVARERDSVFNVDCHNGITIIVINLMILIVFLLCHGMFPTIEPESQEMNRLHNIAFE